MKRRTSKKKYPLGPEWLDRLLKEHPCPCGRPACSGEVVSFSLGRQQLWDEIEGDRPALLLGIRCHVCRSERSLTADLAMDEAMELVRDAYLRQARYRSLTKAPELRLVGQG